MEQENVMQKCDHCQKILPSQKMCTHYSYCIRNFINCAKCHQMYDKNLAQEHEDEFHQTIRCEDCGQKLDPHECESHKVICQKKTKICVHCELEVPFDKFETHKINCQSRTQKCQNCGQDVVIKQYDEHLAVCLSIPLQFRQNIFEQENDDKRPRKSLAGSKSFEHNLHEMVPPNPRKGGARQLFNKETKKPVRKSERNKKDSGNHIQKSKATETIEEVIENCKKNESKGRGKENGKLVEQKKEPKQQTGKEQNGPINIEDDQN